MENLALELLTEIAKLSPVFAILITWLYQSLKTIKDRDKKIDELQEEIRLSEKDNMKVFQQVSETLLNISNDNTNSNGSVLREIKELREYVKDKIK